MCSDQSPREINVGLTYGFIAVGGSSPDCRSCYQLTSTSTVLQGKKMIVQATETGNDVSNTRFDLAVCLTYLSQEAVGSPTCRWSKMTIVLVVEPIHPLGHHMIFSGS